MSKSNAWMRQRSPLKKMTKMTKIPASSPDIKPIENVWAGMKLCLAKTVKPKKKEELVAGTRLFLKGPSVDD